ncbi:MAG TPA: hypothetical protein VM573_08605, partial [Actinomycetota bacterium]|nr:hypothetical protein [Actinomycetota bacterium]
MKHKRAGRLLGAVLALSLLGAACSGGGETGNDNDSGAAPSATESVSEATTPMEDNVATTDGIDTGAAQLNQTLVHGLTEHEYLAGIAVAMGVSNGLDSPEFEAAAAALDENSQDLADAIGSIYGD